jgi:hypothetical protein
LSACYAYSDSVTDLPMLEAVGQPHAVNPDKGLRRVAVERGWPVDDFRRPVHVRTRMPTLPTPPGPPAAYAGLAVAAGALGVAWWWRDAPADAENWGLVEVPEQAYNRTCGPRQRADDDPPDGGPCETTRQPTCDRPRKARRQARPDDGPMRRHDCTLDRPALPHGTAARLPSRVPVCAPCQRSRAIASQTAVPSRAPSATAAAQCRTHCATPSGPPLT